MSNSPEQNKISYNNAYEELSPTQDTTKDSEEREPDMNQPQASNHNEANIEIDKEANGEDKTLKEKKAFYMRMGIDLESEIRIDGEWGPNLEKMSWPDVRARIIELNNEGKKYRLPTAAELMQAFKDKTPGFSTGLYWSSTDGVYEGYPGDDFFPPTGPRQLVDFSTAINMETGYFENARRTELKQYFTEGEGINYPRGYTGKDYGTYETEGVYSKFNARLILIK